MLDLRHVAANVEAVQANCIRRHVDVDVAAIAAAYAERNRTLVRLEELRHGANVLARQTGRLDLDGGGLRTALAPWLHAEIGMPADSHAFAKDRAWLVGAGKRCKTLEPELRARVEALDAELDARNRSLPNLTHPDVPAGAADTDHRVLKTWGTPRAFGFRPKDHVELAEAHGLVDFEAGAKVAGQKFYFLREELVFLDLALQRFALELLVKRGFRPVITPDLARPAVLEGIGFAPRGPESQVYYIEGHDLCLVGTAEIPIGGMLAGDVIDAERLPLRIAGLSHCFRTEAGAGGRESRGLYRVHQFTKVEMFVFCDGELATSDAHHAELLAIEEEIFQALEVPYRVLDIAAGDLGAPAWRKFDVEAWLPGRGVWGEVTSASNCTDFQARRLGIRVKPGEGQKPRFVHTLNGTAVAVSRALIAVLENHQREDGSVALPAALLPYLPFAQIPAWSR
ncbi:MAG: serine--tRNA ligase [Myxococcales bacterium]|nr:serine--tRNA ligase [Myxococcales bacterium]